MKNMDFVLVVEPVLASSSDEASEKTFKNLKVNIKSYNLQIGESNVEIKSAPASKLA